MNLVCKILLIFENVTDKMSSRSKIWSDNWHFQLDNVQCLAVISTPDIALTVFQVKPKTWKSKPTMTSIDISGIKNPDKFKCQEIKQFCFNQKLPVERSFLVDQELDTNFKIVNSFSIVEFILGCCQSLLLDKQNITVT